MSEPTAAQELMSTTIMRQSEKRDKKLLALVNSGYNVMHLSMGYDGNLSKTVCQDGVHLANEIIDRCATMLAS